MSARQTSLDRKRRARNEGDETWTPPWNLAGMGQVLPRQPGGAVHKARVKRASVKRKENTVPRLRHDRKDRIVAIGADIFRAEN